MKKQVDRSPSRTVASAHPGSPDHLRRKGLLRRRWRAMFAAAAILASLFYVVAIQTGQPVPGYDVAVRFGDLAASAVGHIRSAVPDRTALDRPKAKRTRSLSDLSDTGRRVALVVGNGNYRHAPTLANPRNDANDMAAALRDLGFDVLAGTDLSGEAFYKRIDEFEKRTQDAQAALFFYAGHGMQLGNANYLLPVDAKPDSERILKGTAVNLDEVLAGMRSKTRLVFLDACRDNPFLEGIARARGLRSSAMPRGLKRVENADGGMFIAYATAPGDVAADGVGRNSPFTAALKQHIGEQGIEINQVINRVRRTVASVHVAQTPWHTSSLYEDFFFVPDAMAASTATVATLDPAEELWKQIKSSNNVEQFEQFIRTYPNSSLVPVARARLDELQERTLIAELQGNLNAMGFLAGTADGIMGDQTHRAAAAFAQLRGVRQRDMARLVEASREARSVGYQNFLGCRTESSPRTVQEIQQVPVDRVRWRKRSMEVQYEEPFDGVQFCGMYYNVTACASVGEQHARNYVRTSDTVRSALTSECLSEANSDIRGERVTGIRVDGCRCVAGSRFCNCSYEGRCRFEELETYEGYEEDMVDMTVYDEREVCECRAPSVSGRTDCVAARS